MKRIALIILAVAVLAVGSFFGYHSFLAPLPATPTPEISPGTQATTSSVVSAEAFVTPARKVDLAFRAAGRVVEVPVKEGDQVQAGEVLARLDDTDQQLAVTQARSAVAQARAGLLQAQTAVTQALATLESANGAVASAQAQLAKVKAGPTQEVIAQSEAAVRTAQAHLNQVKTGARSEDVDAAAAALSKSEAALSQAQAEYDKISWAGNVGETPQALALQQATLDYTSAQAQYQKVTNGATAQEVEVARAEVNEAQAALAVVKAGPTPEDVAIAEAGVTQAQGQFSAAEAGLANAQAARVAAQAALTNAQVTLQIAQQRLADFKIVAPYTGTVSLVSVDPDAFVTTGAPVISLADTSTWYVKTDDLSEVDVVQVAIGQSVKVTVDALPGQELQGIVTGITPRSETKRGDVTYSVTIQLPNPRNSSLRWGMTAFADIRTGS
jgi:multidrug resistance efflux pump